MVKTANSIEIIATVLFFLAVIHTLFIKKFKETAFLFWALIFILIQAPSQGFTFLTKLNYTEPLFVFVIMCMAATRSIVAVAENIIHHISDLIPLKSRMAFYVTSLIVGPILGSLITEPAAMAMTALILLDVLFKTKTTLRFKYATLALLLVNISIGGTLTHFAAPPVLMVSATWNWDTLFMFRHFGYKALIAIICSTALIATLFRNELTTELILHKKKTRYLFFHLAFLFSTVATSHHAKFFIPIFLLFLVFMRLTKDHQFKIAWKESSHVAFFLLGLVILGSTQTWWIKSFITSLNSFYLFISATILTGVIDNAALTYLGSLVELSDSSKFALLAGAVAGGGLTVIANAPNPVAFEIFKDSFGKEGVGPIRLFLWALIPTMIAMISFWALP